MAFTAIKFVVNLSNFRVEVSNPRTGEDTNGAVQPQGTRTINTWVEWCTNQREFNQSHRIEVRLFIADAEDIVFALWQQQREDGDYVRYSRFREQPLFDPDAPPVPTTTDGARAGGDRTLVVVDDNTIRLEVSGVSASFAAEVTSEEFARAYFQTGSKTSQVSDTD
jgi:hypothetical protein